MKKNSFRNRFYDHLKELHYPEECEACQPDEEKCNPNKTGYDSDEDFEALCDCNAFLNPKPKRKSKLKPKKEKQPSDACCTIAKVIPKATCYVPPSHREFYSVRVLDKYCMDDDPEVNLHEVTLQTALRPLIWLELVAVNRCKIGSFAIQLYTEACPALVMEFTTVVECGDCQRIQFRKIKNPIWIEGKLIRDGDIVEKNTPYYDHCFEALSHRLGPGILSVPVRHLCSMKSKSIPFTLSLNPLNFVKGKRLAIGKIIKNVNILNKLRSLEAMYGCFKYDIAVSECALEV